MTRFRFIDWLRSTTERSRKAALVVANVVLCELGARVGLPGVDGDRVRAFFQGSHGGLVGLYNFLVGGGVSRAAILALGVIPYFQARLYLWLARSVSPAVERATSQSATRRVIVRITTVTLAVVQSFGFARFLQSIPGGVADPGPAFVGRAVVLLTGAAIAAGWLAELIVAPAKTERASDEQDARTRAPSVSALGASTVDQIDTVLAEPAAITELSRNRDICGGTLETSEYLAL